MSLWSSLMVNVRSWTWNRFFVAQFSSPFAPEERFREVVQDLEEDGCRVIDGSHSTILAREEAMEN